ADATEWQATEPQSFDIIISETMTALLKREPQVFIFAHLSQYLKPSGVLIPEEVSLKSWLVNQAEPDYLLGEFFKLDINQ
ncbi:class I SAM-dependent methyltransferase, partial [Pseudoalteromonas ruthenica]